MKDDLISRQAAIDAVIEITYDQTALHHGWVSPYYVVNRLEYLPSADLSEYSDKLWKTAYERGKAETRVIIKLTEEDKESLKKAMNEAELTLMPAEIIHCKECVYYENEAHGLCDLGGEWAPDDYCSYGRRPKHG